MAQTKFLEYLSTNGKIISLDNDATYGYNLVCLAHMKSSQLIPIQI